jgi:hypothetical protein
VFPQITFTDRYTYLGVVMGIDVKPPDVFDKALSKLRQRVEGYLPRKRAFSLHQRITIANCFLISIFSYLYAIYIIPQPLLTKIYTEVGKWVGWPTAYKTELLTHPRQHFGLEQPLKNLELINAAAILNTANNISLTDDDFPAVGVGEHELDPLHQVRQAMRIFTRTTHSDVMAPNFPMLQNKLYRLMLDGPGMKVPRARAIAHKVHLLFKGSASKEEASERTGNLIRNFSKLPRKTPPYVRSFFIRLVYNALPFKDRIRMFARHLTNCTLCNLHKEDCQQVFFSCPTVHSAKLLLKPHAPILEKLSFSGLLLLDPPEHYATLFSEIYADKPWLHFGLQTLRTHVILPILYFSMAVWTARHLIATRELHDEPLDVQTKAKTIAKVFWNSCSDRHGIRALGLLPDEPLPEALDPHPDELEDPDT